MSKNVSIKLLNLALLHCVVVTMLTMTWATFSIFCLSFFIGSISAIKHPNIIGGKNTTVAHFPFIISIRDYDGRHFCGGSIISDRHILTAAHCVSFWDNDDLEFYKIHSGTSRRDREGNVHDIESFYMHPTYNLRSEVSTSDDVAVIKLKKPIEFNKYQQPIKLPNEDVKNYQVAYAIGWGRINSSTMEKPIQLQKLKVALLKGEKCNTYLEKATVDSKQVCAFRNVEKAACHGDSGGPLASHGELVGIVSRGDTSVCAHGVPDIYTNVFAHKKFIESAMEK